MDAFFLKNFQSYDDFLNEFIEWQDTNFQFITVYKSEKLQDTLDKASTYNVKTSINEKFGYNLSSQDIVNLRKSKIKKSQAEQLWDELQNLLDSDQNSVKILKNAKEELECIFIQTSFMRQWFVKYPSVHHINKLFITKQQKKLKQE